MDVNGCVDFTQQHGRALRLTYELDRPRALAYRAMLRWVPDTVCVALRRIFPTLIYVLQPRGVPLRGLVPAGRLPAESDETRD